MLQTGEVERLGDDRARKVDVRLVAATNVYLRQAIEDGAFRADLYYRLATFPVQIPPLRERKGDVRCWQHSLMAKYELAYGKKLQGISDMAAKALAAYGWPGNVRELENVIERGVLLASPGGQIEVEHLFAGASPAPVDGTELDDSGKLRDEDEMQHTRICESLLREGVNLKAHESALITLAVEQAGGQSHPCREGTGYHAAATGLSPRTHAWRVGRMTVGADRMNDASAPPLLTPLSARIGLRYPLVSAPMFLLSNPAMLIAAAEAGILGAMPSLNARTTALFRQQLQEVSASTSGPFAINLTIGMTEPDRLRADLEACIEYGVKVLITSYGDPTPIVAEAHRHGMLVMHDVIGMRHAHKAQAAGVDAVIGVSAGAGGHAGTLSPFAFIPWLASELSTPVVAAGCIGNGDQVLAALSLGAQLCYVGTRFIASDESAAQAAYKAMIASATPDDIVYTDEVSGTPANFLRATLPDGAQDESQSVRKRWRDIWSAGQGVAQIHATAPIGDIVQQIMGEYREALARINALGRP